MMAKVSSIAKAGTLICVDSGEYSDYQVDGFFVALQDFEPMTELAKFLDDHPGQKKEYSFENRQFLAELIRKGYLLEVPYSTLYLGTYSNAEEARFDEQSTTER